MNTDKIREILKSVFDSANYRDMNNVTDKIITAITPYLSHWITEAEAKPGAIERILIDLEKTGAEYKTRINPNDYQAGDYMLQRCAAARAELTQLQAELEALKKQVVQLADEAVGMDVAVKQYKGALRTLAIVLNNENPKDEFADKICPVCEKEMGKSCIDIIDSPCIEMSVAYALAHPTEDHPSPLANDDNK